MPSEQPRVVSKGRKPGYKGRKRNLLVQSSEAGGAGRGFRVGGLEGPDKWGSVSNGKKKLA